MGASIVPAEHWPWLSVLGLVGGLAGALTFAWRVADYLRAYIKIELTVDHTEAGGTKLRTIIDNPNISAKSLHGVFLIVSPVDEPPEETIRNLFTKHPRTLEVQDYNQMVRAISDHIRRDCARITDVYGRMLIPLPYYYRENVDVADEILSFEVILAKAELPAGIYSARLYLDSKNRLHRVVQAAFDVSLSSTSPETAEH